MESQKKTFLKTKIAKCFLMLIYLSIHPLLSHGKSDQSPLNKDYFAKLHNIKDTLLVKSIPFKNNVEITRIQVLDKIQTTA